MWDKTKTGWLMALSDVSNSNWGKVTEFYESIREEKLHNGLIITEGEVWGKHRYKDHSPAVGDGLAFYHSTKATFPKPDPFRRRPRISLIGEILDIRCGDGQVDWFKVAIDETVLQALEQHPIIKNAETDQLFFDCGIGTGAIATFYPANHQVWKEFIKLTKKAMGR